jgi:hypothetical protein
MGAVAWRTGGALHLTSMVLDARRPVWPQNEKTRRVDNLCGEQFGKESHEE